MKRLLQIILLFFIGLVLCQCGTTHDTFTTEQLYQGFQQPVSEYHPFVRWWWNGDKVEADELVREMRLLKEASIGGVEINPIAFPTYCDSLGKASLQWLSPEWINMLKVCFDEAKQLDMTCDLLVGSGWPFGAEFLEENERAQIVVNYAETVTGPTTLTIVRDSLCEKAMPKVSSPYKGNTKELMSLKLYPNPASSVDEGITFWTTQSKVLEPVERPVDSIITIEVPEGEYTLAALVKINGFLEVINGAPGAAGPVLDHFNTEAVNRYLYNMSDKIEAQIGPLKGNIRALFTDSMELEGANWTSDMAEEFEKRYGYDITEWLPFILFKIGSMGSALNYDPMVPVTEAFQQEIQRARYDFEDFKAKLMQERFTSTYLEWCHNLGVKARAQAYGRGFYPLENAMGYDIPEGESWTTNWLRHKPGEEMSETDYRRGRAYTMVNKFVSSAAHLAGNRTVSCEEMTNTYTVFNMTLEQLKIGGDQSAMSGVTHSVFHGYNYSPNLEAKFPGWVRYGAYYSENNNWWPYFKYYNEYKARLSYALQHGTYYADIAILNPENDMWSTIGMQNEPFPNTTRAPYKTMLWEAINKCGGGVDYVSENIINQSEIKRGNLCFNKRKYNTLMLIDVESLHSETAEQLLKFVETGGKIVCIDTIPYQSLGKPGNHQKNDSLVKATMDRVMQHKEQFVFIKPPKEGFIPWYDSLMRQIPPSKGARGIKLPHYLDIENPDPYVMQNRYTTDDGSEMILLSNSHRYNAHQTKITFDKALIHKKQAQIWDLQTGERYALPLDKDGSYTFDMGPVESVLIVFEKTKPIDLPTWQPLHQWIKEMPTNDLSNDWDVQLHHSLLQDTTSTHFDTLFDLKDSEKYQHFCGTIVYRKTLPGWQSSCLQYETLLDLGLVEGVSEVFLNGQSLGVQYFGRRIYDLTPALHEGENKLEVRVTTTMGNYLKTFSREENPTTWVYVNHPRREQPLQPMGMLGPIKLYSASKGQSNQTSPEGAKRHQPDTSVAQFRATNNNNNMKKHLLTLCLSLLMALQAIAQEPKPTYNASKFGIRSDGVTMNTRSIQFAIDWIAEQGGGTLRFWVGRYLTGSIHMKSNVTIELMEGAVLVGSTNPFDYDRLNATNDHGLILAEGVENIRLIGVYNSGGVIEGQGRELGNNCTDLVHKGLMKDKLSNDRVGEGFRPRLLIFRECKNVEVDNVTFRNAANWVTMYDQCENVKVNNIRIQSTAFWNNDGIDIVDCDGFVLTNSYIDASDDAICLKSHSAKKLCQNIEVRHCTARSSASGIKFGTMGAGGFKNVRIIDNTVYDTYRSAITIQSVDGGICENILVDSLYATNVGNAIYLNIGARRDKQSFMDGITIRNLYCEVAATKPDAGYEYEGPIEDLPRNISPCGIIGLKDSKIKNVTLESIEIVFPGGGDPHYAHVGLDELDKVPEMPKAYPEFSQHMELPAWGFFIRHVDGLTMQNIKLTALKKDYRTAIVMDDVNNHNISNLTVVEPDSDTKEAVFERK